MAWLPHRDCRVGADKQPSLESLWRILEQLFVHHVFKKNNNIIFRLKLSNDCYSFDCAANIFQHFSLIPVSNITNSSTSESHYSCGY